MSTKHLSVILATYNRSDYLRQTLEAMCDLEREGLDAEFTVVDNNSTDDTRFVIDAFTERLPLRHLFEARPGKNYALNCALDTVELGEIVVFTDDDVIPCRDWLKQIVSACERWPTCDVFGGRIEPLWPDGVKIPRWASELAGIRAIVFGDHSPNNDVTPYASGKHPAGANFWVRKSVFEHGFRFDESIGPRPGQRFFMMGDEGEFLLRLAAEGKRALHIPSAPVAHHVQTSLLRPWNVFQRYIRLGRGWPHLHGIPDPEKFAKHPWRWRFRRVVAMAWHLCRFCCAQGRRDDRVRMDKATQALRYYAYHREALNMSWSRKGRETAAHDVRVSSESNAPADYVAEIDCEPSDSQSKMCARKHESSLND